MALLESTDPAPCVCVNAGGKGRFVFISEHAGNLVPAKLENLGLKDAELADHIGWDLHIREVGERLSQLLDVPYFCQPYSRLLIDCNRPPGAPQSILDISDHRPIPGNEGLSNEDVKARQDEIFLPFHCAIADMLDERAARGQDTILITLHSFTPAMKSSGDDRPWQITFQYGHDPALSKRLISLVEADPAITVGDNVPYPVGEDTHYGIPVHGEQRGLPHTMIELRQDVIATEDGKAFWANKLKDVLQTIP